LSSFVEYRYWSVIHGCETSRLSVFDAHGQEFYTIIERPTEGKRYREARQEAVETLIDAVERGDEPGEVCQTT